MILGTADIIKMNALKYGQNLMTEFNLVHCSRGGLRKYDFNEGLFPNYCYAWYNCIGHKQAFKTKQKLT